MHALMISMNDLDIKDTIAHYAIRQGYSLVHTEQEASVVIVLEEPHEAHIVVRSTVTYAGQKEQTSITLPTRLETLFSAIKYYAAQVQETPIMLDNGWCFIPSRNIIQSSDTPQASVDLTQKEAQLLYALVNTQHEITKDELLTSIWRYDDSVTTHTVETHMYRLRKKLHVIANNLIGTTKQGYCFNHKQANGM